MATLNGQPINTSYSGLIKTDDNGVVGAVEKRLTDGQGNPLPMLAGTSGISFDGGVDFTAATVTGLPAGPAGTNGTSGTNGTNGTSGTSGSGGGSSAGGYGQSRPWVGNPFGSTNKSWISPWLLTGYTQSGMQATSTENGVWFVPFTAIPGLTLKNVTIEITTGVAGGLVNLGLYKATAIDGILYPTFVAALATNIDASSGGIKNALVSGSVLLPTDAADQMYFIGAQTNNTTIAFTRWDSVVQPGVISEDIYRINAVQYTVPTTFDLPTGTISSGFGAGITDGAMSFRFQYN